ncbi:MAG: 23S rRNA (pseudouridine(1915)-N(3))-methyltransferase RlmH [Bacteroidales bacterium]|nr:23S rRNA (pseudouridine(1915)-N(3))-methyltransferase RlmH [Bacteroidales bacterium]
MKIVLLFTGRTSAKYLEEGISDYSHRISRMTSFEIITVQGVKSTSGLTPDEVKRREGTQMLKQLTGEDYVVLLDERGEQTGSVAFAGELGKMMMKPAKRIVFLTGGAWGVSDEVYRRADKKLSLSRMTFSHQVVRLLFTEQLYRALTIIKGIPYHHE